MITENQLMELIEKWNPEQDSVNILKEAFSNYGKSIFDIGEGSLLDQILNLPYCKKTKEEIKNTDFELIYSIWACDFEGNCLCGELEIINVKEMWNAVKNGTMA